MSYLIQPKRALSTLLFAGLLGVAATFAQAPGAPTPQNAPTPPSPAAATPPRAQNTPASPLVPLKVQVTIARYQGEKKTSSLPFTLWVNANDTQSTILNAGQSVPVPTQSGGTGPITYQNVGTRIIVSASRLDDGRFRLNLNIADSSVAPGKEGGAVSLKSLDTSNFLLLRDGQTAEFVAATDKVNGEVTRIDVTVTTLK